MKHLLVTNDFPPKIGGIQSLLWEWWRRLPPESFAVLTSPYEGTAEFDAAQPFHIERTREPVLLPHPWNSGPAKTERLNHPVLSCWFRKMRIELLRRSVSWA